MSFFEDLRNLDRNNIGAWPKTIKGFFAVLVFALILLAGWWFKIRDQQDTLDSGVTKETTLKADFEKKQKRVVNLPAYRKQLADMTAMLHMMVLQLPSATEMPNVLVAISQTALAAGIETELFQPGPEVAKQVYAEKPIMLKMLGTYHQFGAFISDVASLPHVVILTMHNVSLQPAKNAGKNGAPDDLLLLEGTVKTYHYLDEDTIAAAEAAAAAKKPGRGRARPKAAKGGR
ncbi:MAG: type 4a pilus biogenesis protein PilO [Rhodanobacteraceae bacterium]